MLKEIGEDGQRRLAASSALIVGLGGLGAPVATYLTGAGVGRIGLCDADVVSESNLQRQTLYSEAQLGMPKAEAAHQRLSSMSSHTRFDLHPCGLTTENAIALVSDYDIVLDCTDNYAARYIIDDACWQAGKPWVHGAIGEFNGMVTVFNHKGGKRYADLYPDREAMLAIPHTVSGVLGATPGVVGALQASEALKALAGFGTLLDGRLLIINLLDASFSSVEY